MKKSHLSFPSRNDKSSQVLGCMQGADHSSGPGVGALDVWAGLRGSAASPPLPATLLPGGTGLQPEAQSPGEEGNGTAADQGHSQLASDAHFLLRVEFLAGLWLLLEVSGLLRTVSSSVKSR